MFFASAETAIATAAGLDIGNLEFWVVLTNVAIVVATLMLTKVTAKDAQLHEEKVLDKATESAHDITAILHDVLVKDGLVTPTATEEAPAEESAPLRAVK